MQLEWYLAYVLMLLLLLMIINNSISMDIIETPIDPPLLHKRRIPWWLRGISLPSRRHKFDLGLR